MGSINLTQFVKEENSKRFIDNDAVAKYVKYLVRFLDNVNEYSSAPLPEYIDSMRNKRRIGCGVMGWGSALFMMKVRFGSDEAAAIREELMKTYSKAAYEASIDLAVEKGMFKYCDPTKHSEGVFVNSIGLSPEYMQKLRTAGIRNSSLLSQQPTGNTSIKANIVSGGIEPIFEAEYIRTVIVNTMPEELNGICPKWYEGEWYENAFFKEVVINDEPILRAEINGIVYKIDKSRGLTKEVLCEDYAVHWLKQRGEWDASADWAVTTTNLSVSDHVNDLKGFAKYTDSACSKTVNIPHDYPFEDFKNLYLDVYNTGYIKGFTSYRAGTMSGVLTAKEEDSTDEEIILDDVKLPDSLPAVMKVLRAEGKKWWVTVLLDEGNTKPVAMFVHTNHNEKSATTKNAVSLLFALAREKGIPEQFVLDIEQKAENDNNVSKIARATSLCLRHGVKIKSVVSALDSVQDVFVGSFLFAIRKYLSSFIKDGEVVDGAKCSECGGKVVFQEGCQKCMNCGNSKCG